MKTFLLSIAAFFVAAVASAQVPSVTVENAKGESFDTSALLEEGTPMILSFWSTSCKPCIRELDAVYDAMPDWLDEADFRVVAVSTDDSRLLAKARSFAEGRGWGEEFTSTRTRTSCAPWMFRLCLMCSSSTEKVRLCILTLPMFLEASSSFLRL